MPVQIYARNKASKYANKNQCPCGDRTEQVTISNKAYCNHLNKRLTMDSAERCGRKERSTVLLTAFATIARMISEQEDVACDQNLGGRSWQISARHHQPVWHKDEMAVINMRPLCTDRYAPQLEPTVGCR